MAVQRELVAQIESFRRLLARGVPGDIVERGMARRAGDEASRLYRRRRRQHIRRERPVDQLVGALAGPQRQHLRSQVLQGVQIGLALRTLQDRAGAGPLPARLGDGGGVQGQRPERRVPGCRDARADACAFRALLRIGRAGAGRVDLDAPSRGRPARPLSACPRHDRRELQERSRQSAEALRAQRIHHAADQPDRRRISPGIVARAVRLSDRDHRNHDRDRGAHRLAGADAVPDRRGRVSRCC